MNNLHELVDGTAGLMDAPKAYAALKGVLEVLDRRAGEVYELVPSPLGSMAAASYQFQVQATDIRDALVEALS